MWFPSPTLACMHAALVRLEGGTDLGDAERRRRVLLQFCNAIAVGSMLLFAGLYALIDWQALRPAAWLSLGCIPFYLLSAGLNRKGYPLGAKLVFFLVMTGSIFLSTALFVGRAPGMHFYFLLGAMVPLLLWPIRRPLWILVFMGLNLLGFLFIQFREQEPALRVPTFPPDWVGFFNRSSVVAVYAITVLILVFFQQRAEEDARALHDRAERMEELMRKFEELSNTDPLTGLNNRRAMVMRMEEETLRMTRNHQTFALLLCDIDHFKAVNDQYGHEAGDLVIRGVSHLLRESLREIDPIARWGGEEFLILLHDTTAAGALVVAEKLRASVEQAVFPWAGLELRCTLTLGIALHTPERKSLDETIALADAALYEGKRGGRNRAVLG